MTQNGFEAAKIEAAAMFIYFSGILKKDVVDADKKFLGKVWDISLKFTEVYPKSDELVISKGLFGESYTAVPWKEVVDIEDDIIIGRNLSDVRFGPHPREYDFLLRRDILDQQVVDTYNHKVRRVNDIHLLRVDHELMIAHVDIGLRGLVRRLGWESAVDFCVGMADKNAKYLKAEDFVSWKYIQPVTLNPASMTMKLSVSEKQLTNIPPAELSDIIMDLNINQRIALFKALDIKTKARIFENLELDDQKAMLKELDKRDAAQVVMHMSSDEATDLLEKLPRNMIENILTLMESGRAKKLSMLLGYSGDSAGGLMTTELVSMLESLSVEAAINYIKKETREFDLVPYIYIVDEKNRLKGMTTVRRLLFADPKEFIMKTAFPKTLYVRLNDGVKEVAYFMDKYKVPAIPVVDENNVLHGMITMDDILSQVISIAWQRRSRKTPKL